MKTYDVSQQNTFHVSTSARTFASSATDKRSSCARIWEVCLWREWNETGNHPSYILLDWHGIPKCPYDKEISWNLCLLVLLRIQGLMKFVLELHTPQISVENILGWGGCLFLNHWGGVFVFVNRESRRSTSGFRASCAIEVMIFCWGLANLGSIEERRGKSDSSFDNRFCFTKPGQYPNKIKCLMSVQTSSISLFSRFCLLNNLATYDNVVDLLHPSLGKKNLPGFHFTKVRGKEPGNMDQASKLKHG